MKSSTIRRSTLSKESMEVIENLAKDQDTNSNIDEYIRPEDEYEQSDSSSNKSQEIDLLWQSFMPAQFSANSPTAYIVMGFFAGVIVTLVVILCLGLYVKNSNTNTSNTKGRTSVIENIFSSDSKKSNTGTLEQQADSADKTLNGSVDVQVTEDVDVSNQSNISEPENGAEVTAADGTKLKKYVVKDGDTGESIIKSYYGYYSPELAESIIKVNNLKTLDRINIDQILMLPEKE